MGFCLWASGEQTLLCIEVPMHCQFDSLRGQFTGFGSCLLASGEQTLLCIELHTRLGLNCVCSFRSTQCSLLLVIVSWFGSSPHSKAVTWLTNRHQAAGEHTMLSYSTAYAIGSCSWFNSGLDQVCTARPSCGLQIATRHPV